MHHIQLFLQRLKMRISILCGIDLNRDWYMLLCFGLCGTTCEGLIVGKWATIRKKEEKKETEIQWLF